MMLRLVAPFVLVLLVGLCMPARGGMLQLTTDLENFRLESTDKLKDLYTLRGVYIDNSNSAATEGVQVFISEIRTNVFLVNNVLDIVFLYGLHKQYDDKHVVGEYANTRLREILENLRYDIAKIEDLAVILKGQGQETLATDFYDYRVKLVHVADTIREINKIITHPED